MPQLEQLSKKKKKFITPSALVIWRKTTKIRNGANYPYGKIVKNSIVNNLQLGSRGGREGFRKAEMQGEKTGLIMASLQGQKPMTPQYQMN